MPIELIISGRQITLLEGEKAYPSRELDDTDITRLSGFAESYAALVPRENNRDALVALGRKLFDWLDGEDHGLTCALEQCQPPVILEIRCVSPTPSAAETAVLDAPWEILADQNGFLAGGFRLGFSPVRRLQQHKPVVISDEYRLGLLFMAASPRGVGMLDYEAEEAAIIKAVGEQRIDLVVEESGELDELGHKLASLSSMAVLHLSCHGNNKPEPFLALENDKGVCQPAKASDLTMKLRSPMPRLLFLSACLTAAQPGKTETGPAQSLATAMARAGLPAVIGWNGSVGDVAATLFAQKLYADLSDRHSLEDALFAARFSLLHNTDLKRNDWHLARLWLGAPGGGVLVGGTKERSLLSATHGHKEFLDKKQQVPVASHEMFVGRRRELKEGLRILGAGDKAGLLLLGMGRLGKSSLAARLANRRRDLALAVVHGAFGGAQAILQALAEVLGDSEQAQQIIKASEVQVARDPASLQAVLQRLLCGDNAPCAKAKPVLLVIDDLEKILEASGNDTDPHRVTPEYSAVLGAVLRAFDPRLTKSRLVFTSRYAFGLGGLETKLHTIQLAAFKPEEQQKLLLHQQGVSSLDESEGKARAALVKRALDVSRGNPGLQDLLVGKFVLHAEVPVERAGSVLDQMEAYLAEGTRPTEEEPRQFLEALTLDTLINLAGKTGKDLLRAATVFQVPVPETIMVMLANAEGGNVAHLRGLGLLEPYEDFVDPTVTALAVNALAATRLDPLSETEAKAMALLVIDPLFQAWGGENRNGKPTVTDIELFRLGLLAKQARIVAACGKYALDDLVPQIGNPRTAALGLAALSLCQEKDVEAPVMVLRLTAQACFAAGEVEQAKAVLTELERLLEHAHANGTSVNVYDAMGPYFEFGNILHQQGELEEAEARFRRMHELAAAAGLEREQAIALGKIADILQARGQLDEAMRIRQELQLPVYEKLGDVRSVAVCQGNIADILQARGQLDEAMRIRQELQLPVYEKLGDVRSVAVCQGKIADILQARGQLDEAMRIRQEQELPVYEKLGDVRSVAVCQGNIADILQARGQLDEAMRIRQEQELPVYEKLGDVRSVAVCQGNIADILQARGQLDEALDRLQQQALPAFEKLGDVRSVAVCQGKIADILQARGQLDEALDRLQQQALPAFEKLGDVRSVAVCQGKIADILQARGQLDEAMRIRQELQLPVYEKLGDVRSVAVCQGNIADILQARGQLDEAMRIRQELQLPVYEKLGDVRSVAVCQGNIADILQARGQLDEAMRIRQELQLPVYEKLGDVRSVAVCQGKIADILQARGQLDEAMRIRQEQELPVYEKLGDVRSVAVCQGNIADILQARGQLDEALDRLQQQALPAFEKLGDVRSVAVCQGNIADILQARGQLDEAMRIRQEQELPVYEKLGDVRSVAVCQGKIADILQARGQLDEAMRIRQEQELPVYEKLGDVRSVAVCQGKIADILQARGQLDEALALHTQRLQANQQLENKDGIAATLWSIARIELAQGNLEVAAPKIAKAYSLVSEMGRLEGIAVIGRLFGQLLVRNGQPEIGLAVLQRSLDGFRQLGREQSAQQTEKLLKQAQEDLANQPKED